MVSMNISCYFDAKIVDDQGEGGESPCMSPKAGRELARIVSICAETFLKEVIGELSSNYNSIHTFLDFYVVTSIIDNFVEVIFVDNFLRGHFDWHPHVLWPFHGRS